MSRGGSRSPASSTSCATPTRTWPRGSSSTTAPTSPSRTSAGSFGSPTSPRGPTRSRCGTRASGGGASTRTAGRCTRSRRRSRERRRSRPARWRRSASSCAREGPCSSTSAFRWTTRTTRTGRSSSPSSWAGRDSQLGSVTERFVRKVPKDALVVRNADRLSDSQGAIVVGLDGSPQYFNGLRLGIGLAKALGRPLQAVAVYDPYLHYAMFNGIVGVLSEKASKIFRFKEQEQLHEEIIDTGLAKIYQSHLEIGRKLATEAGSELAITLLDGKCFEKILTFARKEQPWLLILGRIGVHSDE